MSNIARDNEFNSDPGSKNAGKRRGTVFYYRYCCQHSKEAIAFSYSESISVTGSPMR